MSLELLANDLTAVKMLARSSVGSRLIFGVVPETMLSVRLAGHEYTDHSRDIPSLTDGLCFSEFLGAVLEGMLVERDAFEDGVERALIRVVEEEVQSGLWLRSASSARC